jgi:hypothetical protein
MNSDLPLYQPNGRRTWCNGQSGPGGLLFGIDSRSSIYLMIIAHPARKLSSLSFNSSRYTTGQSYQSESFSSRLGTGLQCQQDRQETSNLHWSYRSCDIGIALVSPPSGCRSTDAHPRSGLSTTFWFMIVVRCLSGALNGNVAVIKAAIGDITDETNSTDAFALYGLTWTVGSIVGYVLTDEMRADPQ